jgi:hypothetical protein
VIQHITRTFIDPGPASQGRREPSGEARPANVNSVPAVGGTISAMRTSVLVTLVVDSGCQRITVTTRGLRSVFLDLSIIIGKSSVEALSLLGRVSW